MKRLSHRSGTCAVIGLLCLMAVPATAQAGSDLNVDNNVNNNVNKSDLKIESKTDVEGDILKNIDAVNLMQPEPMAYTSGQPTKEQLQAMAESGIKHVINLRPDSEMDWDERQYVESLGMTYAVLPIASAADLTVDNAAALDELLTQTSGEPVLVHCASGNRVGAVIAIREGKLKNQSLEQAIETGKEWGLTKMEPQTREALSAD